VRLSYLAVVLTLGTALAAGQGKQSPRAAVLRPVPQATKVHSVQVSPSTLSLSANDPDGSGPSSGANVIFWMTGGDPSRTWTLSVAAGSAFFSGCATVPVSAVRVACTGGSGTCTPVPVRLSTSLQQVASGPQAQGSVVYQVSLSLTFDDSWRYIAQQTPPCNLTLTYSVDAP
jgi:hypothetical protein